jgi:hypothetical protein
MTAVSDLGYFINGVAYLVFRLNMKFNSNVVTNYSLI